MIESEIDKKADAVIECATQIIFFIDLGEKGEIGPRTRGARAFARRLALDIESKTFELVSAASAFEAKLSPELQEKVDRATRWAEAILGEVEFSRIAIGQEPIGEYLLQKPRKLASAKEWIGKHAPRKTPFRRA